MELIHSIKEFSHLRNNRPSVLTIGVFDGIHLGHQELIKTTVAEARSRGGLAAVLTFPNHPLSLLAPPYCPRRLLYLDRKRRILESFGIDVCMEIPFDNEFSRLDAQLFVESILVETCAVTAMVCGVDFRFGSSGIGTPALLRDLGLQFGFDVLVAANISTHNVLVKSTQIRDMLFEGDVSRASTLLSRPYELRGNVVTGAQRGRLLGFPTANLVPSSDFVIPGRGVYICAATAPHLQDPVPAMVNIGLNPTFGGTSLKIEAHLLNWTGDLVHRNLHLHFLKRLREEQRFGSVEELKTQLRQDESFTRTWYASEEAGNLLNRLSP